MCREDDTRSVGQRIANCATVLGLDLFEEEEQGIEARLRAMRPCGARLCPFCEWRRTRAWRKRLLTGLEAFQEAEEERVPLFLTLTVPNPRLEDLRSTLRQMTKAWNNLSKQRWFPTDVWFRRTEVTVGARSAHEPVFAHPHFHVLLLVKKSYFGKRYIKQTAWADHWTRLMGADQRLIVDIRRVNSPASARNASGNGSREPLTASKTGVLEVAKYMAKGTQLLEIGESLPEFHRQMASLRLYALSKKLRRYVKEGDISAQEMLDNDDTNPESRLPDATAIARWFEDTQEYLFTEIS